MPRTPQQNQRRRADTRRRLLAAARTTFARLGVQRSTIRDIAQEAGVAQGLLYSYFRDKDDLLRVVFLEGTRDVADAFADGDTGGTAEERLARLIRRSFDILRERRDFWQLSYMLRHQPGTVELLGDELTAWTAAVRGHLETLLRDVGHADAPALAHVLFGAIDGVSQHYVMAPDEYPLEAAAECLVRHFAGPTAAPAAGAGPTITTARTHRARGETP